MEEQSFAEEFACTVTHGIGLALSRQIVEGHGGTLTLRNRSVGHGCEAHLRLPRNGGY